MIGTTLDDRYAILRLIGKGGMGAVYEARNTRTNRRVAVKLIQGAMDAAHVARFQREASVVGAVDSQHITLVYDTGIDPTTRLPYIAMEMLEGEDVDGLLDRMSPVPVDLALRITYQACLGLEAAHKVGIVHRDIKGANLFLHKRDGHERVVKILDFGIAKTTGAEVPHGGLTQTGTVLGSPLYMSPEQAKGGHIDARSDLWSLGITLYEMLSGSQPLVHIQQLGELIIALCTQPVPSLQARAPHLPPAIVELVHRALQIDVAARYQSAAEMAQAIRAFLPHGTNIDESMLHPSGNAPAVGGPQAPHVGAGSYSHVAGAQPPVMPPGQTGPHRPQFGSAPMIPPMAAQAPGQTGPHRPQFASGPMLDSQAAQAPGQTGPHRPQFASAPIYPHMPAPAPEQTGPHMAHATSAAIGTGAHAFGGTAAMSTQQPARTSKVPLIIGGIALLAVGGIGAIFVFGGGSDKPLPTAADAPVLSAQPTAPVTNAPQGATGEPALTAGAPAASNSSTSSTTAPIPPSGTGIARSYPTASSKPASTVKRPTKDEETSRK